MHHAVDGRRGAGQRVHSDGRSVWRRVERGREWKRERWLERRRERRRKRRREREQRGKRREQQRGKRLPRPRGAVDACVVRLVLFQLVDVRAERMLRRLVLQHGDRQVPGAAEHL